MIKIWRPGAGVVVVGGDEARRTKIAKLPEEKAQSLADTRTPRIHPPARHL